MALVTGVSCSATSVFSPFTDVKVEGSCHRKLLLFLPRYLGVGVWGGAAQALLGHPGWLRAAVTSLPGPRTSSSAESSPCGDICTDYRAPTWTCFPSTSHSLSSFFLTGRGRYSDCFGSIDCPFYFTDNEFRIKTIGPLNPGPSFHSYIT